ncbi:MAG: tRNA uridine-5-carboxymethylaminomethyl(34) synthesis GTPase MnmE [Dysgonamonadaceae bacterium]|nr:tRNA uridine-5-carboxymethylaminomethyl(34) synthesis GTPase MnmE [Dysgonamonadaceae bacterium]
MNENTICAISTPSGIGGMAVIRVSGKDAFSVVDKIFTPSKKEISLSAQKAYTLSHGKICKRNEILDDVIVGIFHSPNSFTGENTVEITCHGSLYIQQEILKLLLENGCTPAAPGEFTQRAFLNGKMDLSQAEAVADLIASASSSSHRLAMNQMRGGFSNELIQLRAKLLDFVSLIELELDFGEENVEFADRFKLLDLANNIKTTIEKLIQSFGLGNAIKNGIPVVIVGETNAGKSTLLNHLLNEDKAIVSEIHGTTRDIIEDIININGIIFRFIDTAGIRDTGDEIENLGIQRTFKKIEQASIIIWMIDTTHFNKEIEYIADKIVPYAKNKELIIVFNKIDKLNSEEQSVLEDEFLPHIPAKRIFLSAKFRKNTELLEKALMEAAKLPEWNNNDIIVTNIRHYEALSNALTALKRAETGLNENRSSDFVAQDIRECIHYLGEITGEISTDEILGNIFSKFCVGK